IFDVDWGVIPNLRNTRIVIYQSLDDPNVPPDANQFAVGLLAEARERWGGYDYEYWEVDGHGHDLPPGGADAHFAKIEDARRVARPAQLVWQPVLAWKRQFHWLHWETPVATAIVEAELDREQNAVAVRVDKPAPGLAVLLDDDLLDLDREVVARLNGEEVYRGVPERSLAVLVETGASGDPGLTFSARIDLRPR
ncbi:MAG TPA: hypothetical protein VJP77_05940, partial [Planctomycetota bacterium]|nr:hypothetical protein [Planctomycetota bacterium]